MTDTNKLNNDADSRLPSHALLTVFDRRATDLPTEKCAIEIWLGGGWIACEWHPRTPDSQADFGYLGTAITTARRFQSGFLAWAQNSAEFLYFCLPAHDKSPSVTKTPMKPELIELLKDIAIALGINDELKTRPDSPGFWWMVRPGGECHIGRAEVIHWGEEDSGERVLAWTAGGTYSRCDMINTPQDSGTRWAKAEPPIL